MKLSHLFLGGMSLMMAGCTTRLTDFTIISTKNIDFSTIGRAKRANNRAEGKDIAHIIILFPTSVPNMKEAIDRAIESVPGAVALVDGVLYQRFFYIPYVYGQSAFIVEGTPLIAPCVASRSHAKWQVAEYNASQKSFITRAVSKEEYGALKQKWMPVGTVPTQS